MTPVNKQSKEARLLVWSLYILAVMTLLALPFVFVPFKWMNWMHGMAGLGPMPSEPVVGYLARATSMLYAGLGVIKLVAASDIERYRGLIWAIGGFMLANGVIFTFVDYFQGMGIVWAIIEGGASIFWGTVVLWLNWKVAKV